MGNKLFSCHHLRSNSDTSDPSYPLTFKVVRKKGCVYLCGRGEVITPQGTGEFGKIDDVYSWVPCLTSSNPLTRQGAVQAIGWLGGTVRECASRCLRDALEDRDMDVRRDAAEALEKPGSNRDIRALKKATGDADIWTAEVAKQAILTIQKRISN